MSTSQKQSALQNSINNDSDLKEVLEKYEEKNKLLLSRFTHEIRNPLTLIYSTLQLLDRKYINLRTDDYWIQLKNDMGDVFSLLDQLSNYNKSNSLHITTIDLLSLLTDLKISFEPFAKEKNVMLTLKIEANTHDYITSYNGDYIKLKQAFTNIIKNAVEAVNSNGFILITLAYNDEHSNICITITNSGDPIPSETLSQIFIPFVTTKSQGTGMGLPISSRIIQAHGGYIDVKCELDSTSFLIFLP